MEARMRYDIGRQHAAKILRRVADEMLVEAHPDQRDMLPFSKSRRYRCSADLIVTVSIERVDAPSRSLDAGKMLA